MLCYGQKAKHGPDPYDGNGPRHPLAAIGRPERGHYELAAGGDAACVVKALENSPERVGLLPGNSYGFAGSQTPRNPPLSRLRQPARPGRSLAHA